jgi:hypothetical protein
VLTPVTSPVEVTVATPVFNDRHDARLETSSSVPSDQVARAVNCAVRPSEIEAAPLSCTALTVRPGETGGCVGAVGLPPHAVNDSVMSIDRRRTDRAERVAGETIAASLIVTTPAPRRIWRSGGRCAVRGQAAQHGCRDRFGGMVRDSRAYGAYGIGNRRHHS